MGLIFGGAYIRRGLCTEGNLRFKIDWASLIVGRKFTVFALFYFLFEGNFPSTRPQGSLYLEGRFNGGFFALPVWKAYIWRGLYVEGLISGSQVHVQSDPIKMDTKGAIENQCPYKQAVDIKQVELQENVRAFFPHGQ